MTRRSGGLALVLLLTLTTLVLAPYLIRGLPDGHDRRYHLAWQAGFYQQLSGGEFYPRWLVHLGPDLGGAAVFFFYPPLGFFVASLFGAAGLSVAHQVLGASLVSVFIGVLGAYLWLRVRFDARAAALGAVLYLLMPYHLMIDLSTRLAFGELWALAFIPWVLWSVELTVSRRTASLAIGALSSALLLLSHAPTSVTFFPLPVLYSLYVAHEARTVQPVLLCAASGCLGAGLAAVYLLPALTHGSFVQQQHLFADVFDYRNSFLFFPPYGWDPTAANFLQIAQRALSADQSVFKPFITFITTLQLLACWAGLWAIDLIENRQRASPTRKLALGSAAVAGGYYFLNLQPSQFLWERLTFLAHTQFPWRDNAELLLCAALIGACLTKILLESAASVSKRRIAGGLAVSVLALLIVNVGNSLRYPVVTGADAQADIQGFVGPDDYLSPRLQSPAALFPPGERAVFIRGQGTARVLAWRARAIDLSVSTPGGGTLAIAEQFYPGWTAQVIPGGQTLPVDRLARQYGVLAVEVPAGDTRIAVRLGWTPYEWLGWRISAVSAALLLVIALWGLRQSKLIAACRRRHKSVTAPS